MKAVLAAALLPYTLNVSGQGPCHAKAGVPSCLAAATDDLRRQRCSVSGRLFSLDRVFIAEFEVIRC